MRAWFPPIPRFLAPTGPPPSLWIPAGPWPQDSPESQGMNRGLLNSVTSIDHGVVIRNGIEVWSYGDPGRTLDWASCNRTWKNLLWGDYYLRYGLHWLNRPPRELPCACAGEITDPAVLMKHINSYTSQPIVGNSWHYSCGFHWPWQSKALAQLNNQPNVAEAWNAHIRPRIGGTTWQAGTADDGTLRVKASARDAARMMGLYLSGGVGLGGEVICNAEYIALSTAGGPDGTGHPYPFEGYQTHLIRGHQAWELDLPGVPDGQMARDGNEDDDHGHGAIVAIPELQLIVAARGATPEWWLPTICKATREDAQDAPPVARQLPTPKRKLRRARR